MSANLPGYVFGGLGVAVLTAGMLLWMRARAAPVSGDTEIAAQALPLADYEQLFTQSGHPMFVYDVQTLGFLAVNDAMLRRYGHSRAEFLRMTLADLHFPEDVEAMKAIAREARKSRSATLPGIWRHKRKDGSVLHARVSSHELPFAGRPSRMVQINDMSADVALQAEREEMIARLQHSREWLSTAINAGRIGLWERDLLDRTLVLGGRWADIVGTTPQAFGPVTEASFHALCHPDDLPRVRARFRDSLKDPSRAYVDDFRVKHAQGGWVQMLARGRVVERMSDGRARRVVGTLVDIADLEAPLLVHATRLGHQASLPGEGPDEASFDLPVLLDEALAAVAADVQERGIALLCEIERPLPAVRADRRELKQCVSQLLGHALEHNHAPGRLRLGARATVSGEVELWVWHSGPGLSPQQLQQLSEPLACLSVGGPPTEPDLAATRRQIVRLGGKLSASSEAGEWTLLAVTLPAASTSAA